MTRRPPMPLAARVAEKVMGWRKAPPRDDPGFDGNVYYDIFLDPDGWHVNGPQSATPWDPIANPADLMDVIGAMRELRYDCTVTIEAWGALVEFFGSGGTGAGRRREPSRKSQGGWRAALARAVCRAALEAVR